MLCVLHTNIFSHFSLLESNKISSKFLFSNEKGHATISGHSKCVFIDNGLAVVKHADFIVFSVVCNSNQNQTRWIIKAFLHEIEQIILWIRVCIIGWFYRDAVLVWYTRFQMEIENLIWHNRYLDFYLNLMKWIFTNFSVYLAASLSVFIDSFFHSFCFNFYLVLDKWKIQIPLELKEGSLFYNPKKGFFLAHE